uniref:Haloacid dehalogenase-like hydrolase n=1 Tax=Musca domestica TaxID=7370 RepID=A0A1I8NF95_MUSDO
MSSSLSPSSPPPPSIHSKTLQTSSPSVKFIEKLTDNEKRDFLNSFDLVFCDCDGVIWHNLYDIIPGASDAIQYLRGNGKKVVFVTNNSISSTKDQLRKFSTSNIPVEEQDLIHPAKTISDFLKDQDFKGLILCFASSAFKQHLRDSGFEVVEEKERLIDGSVMDLHKAIYNKDPVKAVVIDIDFNLTAWKLMRAQVLLKNPECLFIAGAADPRIPFGGHELLGPGSFMHIVEEANQRKAKVFGKPGAELGELLKSSFQIKDPKRVLMVGDSLRSDIQFGKECGFQTLLVLTGAVEEKHLESQQLNELNSPDYVIEKLADLKNLI